MSFPWFFPVVQRPWGMMPRDMRYGNASVTGGAELDSPRGLFRTRALQPYTIVEVLEGHSMSVLNELAACLPACDVLFVCVGTWSTGVADAVVESMALVTYSARTS